MMNPQIPDQTTNLANCLEIDEVIHTISELTRKTFNGGYLYRGEPKCYPRVESTLYRHYDDIDSQQFNIETVQNELLNMAKGFTSETDKDEILAQLQHYGHSTNLVDFTTDLNVALFFACDGQPDEDGRVVLLKGTNPHIVRSHSPANRVVAQKSVFVRPPEGYVEPDDVFKIHSHLKQPILQYLNDCHGITWSTIYNDLHGFIRHRAAHRSAYAEFVRGIALQENGKVQKAIKRFSESLRLNPQIPLTYVRRAISYSSLHDHKSALKDLDAAIALSTQDANFRYVRGITYMEMGQYDAAILDLDNAIELDREYVDAYIERGIAFSKKGEAIAAIRDFDKVVELDPSNPRAYELRGREYSLIKDYDRAIRDFGKLIKLDENNPKAFSLRGYSKVYKGDYDDAVQDFDTAIELDQEQGFPYAGRAMARIAQSLWDQAEKDLERAQLKGTDISLAFQATFLPFPNTRHDFEEEHGVKLPGNIAEMLGANEE